MTRSDYWRKVTAANPQLATCSARLSPAQIKRFFEQVWDAAYEAGRSAGFGDAFMVRLFGGDKGGNR